MTQELRTDAKHKRGFTLIEIILVLSIIAILLGAAIFHVSGVGIRGKIARVRADFSAFRSALNMYQMDGGTYPSTEQGLMALVKKPTTGRPPKNYQPSMRKLVKDPWGTPYGYVWPSKRGSDLPDIYSFGPDTIEGTEDDIHMFDDDEEEGS